MKKQIVYSKLIPRLFATSIDLLLLSVILPYIEIPIYKTLYHFLFADFVLTPELNKQNFPYDSSANVKEFFAYLESHDRMKSYIIFIVSLAIIKFVMIGAYFITMWYYKGASCGKMFMRKKIVDAESFSNPTLSQLIKRYVSLLTVPIGIWSVIFNTKKQAMHDKIARTVVVKS